MARTCNVLSVCETYPRYDQSNGHLSIGSDDAHFLTSAEEYTIGENGPRHSHYESLHGSGSRSYSTATLI